jgi:hypothetical protein
MPAATGGGVGLQNITGPPTKTFDFSTYPATVCGRAVSACQRRTVPAQVRRRNPAMPCRECGSTRQAHRLLGRSIEDGTHDLPSEAESFLFGEIRLQEQSRHCAASAERIVYAR